MLLTLGLDDKEKIQRQKLLLNRKLGLDGPAATEDLELFTEEDLCTAPESEKKPGTTGMSVSVCRSLIYKFTMFLMSGFQLCRLLEVIADTFSNLFTMFSASK